MMCDHPFRGIESPEAKIPLIDRGDYGRSAGLSAYGGARGVKDRGANCSEKVGMGSNVRKRFKGVSCGMNESERL